MRTFLASKTVHLFFLVVITFLVYARTMSVPFVYDDYPCIVNNPAIHDLTLFTDIEKLDTLQILPDIKNSIRTRTVSYLTFAANYRIHSLEVGGYHLVNTAVHAANACLFYLLAGTVIRLARRGSVLAAEWQEQGGRFIPFVAALIFAVHPVNTNAVTYITQRFTSLVTLLYLAAMLTYIHARSSDSGKRRIFYYILSLLVTVVAMDTNEMAFTIPIMMTVVEMMFMRGRGPRRALLLSPYYAAMMVIPLTLQSISGTGAGMIGGLIQNSELMNLDDIPRLSYLFTQFRVIITYLRLMIFPVGLNLDYDYPIYHSFTSPPVFVSFFLLVLLLCVPFYLLSRARDLGSPSRANLVVAAFGIFWFCISLSMTSSIIPINDVINEYRLYLPSVGFILSFVCLLDALALRFGVAATRYEAAAVVMVVAILAIMTVARNELWRDSVGLWEDVVRKSPLKVRPAENLADEYMWRDRPDQAIRVLREVIDRNPYQARAHYFLGTIYLRLGRAQEALWEFKKAEGVKRDQAEIHTGLAKAYLELRHLPGALGALETARRLEPNNKEVLQLLGTIKPLLPDRPRFPSDRR